MSARALGERLLSEVEEDGLDELLHLVRDKARQSTNNAVSFFNFPELDNLVHISQVAAHKVQQRQSAPSRGPLHISHSSNLLDPVVIEVSDTAPCSGKTHFLYYLTAISLLPARFNDLQINGKEGLVVVLDTDGRFSIPRLAQVMHYYLRQRLSASHSPDEGRYELSFATLIESSLSHLHLFRPQSSASLISIIANLADYLFDSNAHFSSGRALETVLLDSISAFLWQDKTNAEQLGHPDEANENVASVFRSLVAALQSMQRQFGCAVISTNWGIIPSYPKSKPAFFHSHLPHVWNTFCTMRLVIRREDKERLPPTMSAEEARQYSHQLRRNQRATFTVSLDLSGSTCRRDTIFELIKVNRTKSSFEFWIGEEGVLINSEDQV